MQTIDNSLQDETVSFELLHLKARASAANFLQKDIELQLQTDRSLTTENEIQLRQLAKACTMAYEDVFQIAKTKYIKACLTAEWWSLYLNPRYTADSKIMRQASPKMLILDGNDIEKKVSKQALVFKEYFRSLLDISEKTKNWSDESKTIFSLLMSKEYSELGVIDIPDDVFNDILNDMQFFVCYYMPNIDIIEKEDSMRNTMRWYLWRAMTYIPTDDIEKQFVEKQVKDWSEEIAKAIDKTLGNSQVLFKSSEYKDRFIQCYMDAKDNRFIPYFKHVLFEQDYNKSKNELKMIIDQFSSNWQNTLGRFNNKSEVINQDILKERKEQIDKTQLNYATNMYSLMFKAFTLNCRPALYGKIPNEQIQLSSASMNNNWFWVFTVNTVVQPSR